MRTTKNIYNVPRLLVRITKEDRTAMSEKTIQSVDGIKTLYMNAPWIKPKNERGEETAEDNNKLSVRYGTVVGMSEGVGGYRRGDIVILDYLVDVDNDYFVRMENEDKIVAVPCMTTLCQKELVSTSYDDKFIERNVIVEKRGEVDQLSLVLGIVRNKQFIANDHYVFCEPPLPQPQSLILFSDSKPEITHIKRKVIFASKKSGIKPGQEIFAVKDSNLQLEIAGRNFEIINYSDVLATIEEKVA